MGVVRNRLRRHRLRQHQPTEITTGTSRVCGPVDRAGVGAQLRLDRGPGAARHPRHGRDDEPSAGQRWRLRGVRLLLALHEQRRGYIATIGQDTGQTTDPNTITMIARFSLATPTPSPTAYLVDHNAYTAPITGPQIP